MKYRPQRGALADAMLEMVEIETGEALIKHIAGFIEDMGLTADDVRIKPYGHYGQLKPDPRIGWNDTWIVMVGEYPAGFTDGPPPGHDTREPWRSGR